MPPGVTHVEPFHQNTNYETVGLPNGGIEYSIIQDRVLRATEEDLICKTVEQYYMGLNRAFKKPLVNNTGDPFDRFTLLKLCRSIPEWSEETRSRLWDPEHVLHNAALNGLNQMFRYKAESEARAKDFGHVAVREVGNFAENARVTLFCIMPESIQAPTTENEVVCSLPRYLMLSANTSKVLYGTKAKDFRRRSSRLLCRSEFPG